MTYTYAPPSGFISPLHRRKPRQETAAARRRYRRALVTLARAGTPYLVGGAYAMERYTSIARWTKDLDLFILPRDVDRALGALRAAGFETELTYPHWLAKAFAARDFVDLIFSSGNGIAEVDEEWMRHGTPGTVLGVPVRLCPPEEMIWSKAFVTERERYDGADIAHLIRAGHDDLDWERLLRRFGEHWRLLLSHLVLFEFVYPREPAPRARALARRLARRLAEEGDPAGGEPLCQGTLLSRAQYLPDITVWGYADARLAPCGRMTEDDVARWTAAVRQDQEARDAHRGGG
jgi:Domain of unknown function (DUF1814).